MKAHYGTETAKWGIFLLSILFLALFFYTPVFTLLEKTFFSAEGKFTLSYIKDVFASGYNLRIISFTLKQAFLSTVFSLILGLPGAYFIARKDFYGKSVLKAVSMVPFVLPSILVVLGFVIFFGNNGYLNRFFITTFSLKKPPLRILYSMKAIILAHGFYNFPIAMRIIASLWENLDKTQEHAANCMGARGAKTFFSITLPQLLPAIISAAALIFLFCFSSFVIILVLGGGPAYTTIEVEIYRQAKTAFNLKTAGALAVTGIFFSSLLMFLSIHFQSKTSIKNNFILAPPKQNTTGKRKWSTGNTFLLLYAVIILLLVLSPIVSVILKSFHAISTRGGKELFSIKWYKELFVSSTGISAVPALEAVKNSLLFALMTTLISVPIGITLSYSSVKRWVPSTILTHAFDTIFMLPLIVSSVILGLSYMVLGSSPAGEIIPKKLLIIFAHTIIAYPFVIRSVTGVLEKIKPSISNAAASMGAHPVKIFTSIELPLLKNAILTGAAFAFAISIGELNATILLAGSKTLTIPLVMYQLIGSYNFYGACALGTILVLLTTISFIILETIGTGKRNIKWG